MFSFIEVGRELKAPTSRTGHWGAPLKPKASPLLFTYFLSGSSTNVHSAFFCFTQLEIQSRLTPVLTSVGPCPVDQNVSSDTLQGLRAECGDLDGQLCLSAPCTSPLGLPSGRQRDVCKGLYGLKPNRASPRVWSPIPAFPALGQSLA